MGRPSGWLLLRRFFAVALVIPLLGVASGGLAVLATHDDSTQFHGCVNNRTGFMRIVEDPERCITRQYSGVSLEREITWNQSGPRGFDGAAGLAGAPGAPGQAGDVGPQGPAGQNGVDGVNGEKGDSGLQGPQGAQGVAGPTGPIGPQGLAGEDGSPGADGEKGDPGTAGPQGATGQTGPAGPAGLQGLPGSQGPAGPTGPQGPPGENSSEGSVGPMGPQGPAGAAGPAGQDGATGAQGPAGPPGPEGTAGATGETGPQGEPGSAGGGGGFPSTYIRQSPPGQGTLIHLSSGLRQHVVTCNTGDMLLSGGFGLDNRARSYTIHITRPVHDYNDPATPETEALQGWLAQVKITDDSTWTVWALCADTNPG
ncbi:hypothetical protein BH23CHL1_BH23CHL1_12650 [soil metagenome]